MKNKNLLKFPEEQQLPLQTIVLGPFQTVIIDPDIHIHQNNKNTFRRSPEQEKNSNQRTCATFPIVFLADASLHKYFARL